MVRVPRAGGEVGVCALQFWHTMSALSQNDAVRAGATAPARFRALIGLVLVLTSLSCSRTPARTPDAALVFEAVGMAQTLLAGSLNEPVRMVLQRRQSSHKTEFGVEEDVAGATVRYFAERGESSEPVSTSARITSIEATWVFKDDATGNTLWVRFVGKLSRLMPMPVECGHSDIVQRRYRVAVWKQNGGAVVVQQRLIDLPTAGVDVSNAHPSLSVTVALDSVAIRPVLYWTRGVPCTV